jgi:hypothetical protein
VSFRGNRRFKIRPPDFLVDSQWRKESVSAERRNRRLYFLVVEKRGEDQRKSGGIADEMNAIG